MNNLAGDVLTCRGALQDLLAVENYDTENFATLWQRYQHALIRYCEGVVQADAELLQGELYWVQQVIVLVNEERSSISQRLVSLQQGRKAIGHYGRFPAE